MAKKLGKLFLFSAAVGAVAGSAYYYFQHKDSIGKRDDSLDEDEDFDDFSEDLDEEPARSYVDLDMEAEQKDVSEEKTPKPDRKAEFSQKAGSVAEKVLEKTADALTVAAGKITETAKALDNAMKATETTEEFFDDEDADSEGTSAVTEETTKE